MTAHDPRVVIGMPVYNSARWLSSTLASLRAQTWTRFRIVVCDNASTDDTFALLQSEARHDPRIQVFRNLHNLGICGNFRRVFELGSDSDYFLWASSHDYFAPEMLERCLTTLQSRPDAVLCCGRTALFEHDPADARIDAEVQDAEHSCAVVRMQSILASLRINHMVHGLIRTDALKRTRLVEDYYSSDNILVAHLALLGKLVQLPEVLFYRRMEQSAASAKMSEAELSKHWDPSDRGITRYTSWKIGRGLLHAVFASGLAPKPRLHALGIILRAIYWSRGRLAAELAEGWRAARRSRLGSA